MKRALIISSAIAMLATAPAIAQAQEVDRPFEHAFVGRVVSFQPFNLQLDRGPHINLHRGTVINPTGLDLRYGQIVRVIGHRNFNGTFSADEIDLVPRERYDRDRF